MALICVELTYLITKLSNILCILNIFSCDLIQNQLKTKSKTFFVNKDHLIFSLIIILTLNSNPVKCDSNVNSKIFTNDFAVSLKDHKCDQNSAQSLADRHGFQLIGQIGSIDCHYLLRLHRISKRSTDYSHSHHSLLSQDSDVSWVQQQHIKTRVKRDYLSLEDTELRHKNERQAENHCIYCSNKTHPIKPLDSDIIRHSTKEVILKSRRKRDFVKLSTNNRLTSSSKRLSFDDPRWPQMWYLNRGQGLDMNVQLAWAKNITGRGAVVTILDDGLEKDHPDLIANYDPMASFDVNNHDEDPMPRYDMIDSNRHGTRCAGEVAANANNNICAIGIAYNAKVGGVRMLDGDVTDAVEARSLSLNPQHIDIYSASWGPDDDGKTVDGPGELATRAFIDGVTKGRNGLGSIFVWASGNGGREHDNCNCDGYTNSIWTLSISSATENGLVPWYSEACSSTLATTYSSGSFGERQIVTTDLHHGCTNSHTGTSASAPLAAGICALALEANPGLTWRDMQHIAVQSARPANLHARDWKTNGVGRNVSHSFGYGLLDANAMVDLAKDWVTVPTQKMCEVRSQPIDKLVPAKSYIEMSLKVSCENVKFLEHVQAKVTLTATRRGDIHVYLTSPSGTRSTLLAQRPMDNSRSGFQNWPFMTVHSWGENPNGEWRLEIHNEGRYYISSGLQSIFGRAFLKEWTLVLYGTSVIADRRHQKLKSTINGNSVKPSVPLSTSTPIRDFSRIIGSQKSVTKAPVFDIKNNNIEDEENGDHIVLSDSQNKHMYNYNEGWPILVHGTRESQNPGMMSEGAVSGSGCALSDPALRRCIECMPGLLLFNDVCVSTCPENYFMAEKSTRIDDRSSTSGVCIRCHYSCKHCFGSNDNECTQCYSDAVIHRNGHCFARELVQEVTALEKWYTAVAVVFLCLCFVILTLVIYIITDKNPHILCCFAPTVRREGVYDGLPMSGQHSIIVSTNSTKNNRNNYQIEDISEEDL